MIINTTNGNYVVPADREPALIQWLEANAMKVAHAPTFIKEHTKDGGEPVYLITETE